MVSSFIKQVETLEPQKSMFVVTSNPREDCALYGEAILENIGPAEILTRTILLDRGRLIRFMTPEEEKERYERPRTFYA